MPRPNWYVKITFDSGKTWHSDPWMTAEAAEYHVKALCESPAAWVGFMRRRPW